MDEMNLREIQEAMVDNLKFVHAFCEEHGLTYYLAYGTLIGAIRHKGFIPWDDDNDIWMPRKDYEMLIKLCDAGALEGTPYRLCTRKRTQNYPYGIARLSNENYSYVTTRKYELQFDIGIFTDIYPLDNYCDSIEKAHELHGITSKINKDYARWSCWRGKNQIRTLPKIAAHVFLTLKYGMDYSQRVDDILYEVVKKYTTEEDAYIGVPIWGNFLRYPKTAFASKVLVSFEGEMLYAPCGYDDVLKAQYGDYMILPPEDKRTPSHGYKIYRK